MGESGGYTPRKLPAIVPVLGFLGLFLFSLLALFASYFGAPISSHLSFQVEDGWCTSPQGIGGHCFGDFGLPWGEIQSRDPYAGQTILASNPPLVLLLFKYVLGPLDYNVALIAYLSISVVSVSLALFLLARNFRFGNADSATLVLVGLTSIGFLTAFDRGNHVWMVVPLIVWAILAESRGQSLNTVLSFAVLGAVKFWGPVFTLILAIRGKWKEFFLTLPAIALLYGLPVAFLSELSLSQRIQGFVAGVLNDSVSMNVSQYSISPYGLGLKVYCDFLASDCNLRILGELRLESQWLAVVAGAVMIIAAVLSSYFQRKASAIWLPFFLLPIVALPESSLYNLVVLPVAMVIASANWNENVKSTARGSRIFLVFVLISMVPLAVDFGLVEVGSFAELTLSWKTQAILAPLLLGLLTLIAPFLFRGDDRQVFEKARLEMN